MTIYTHNLDELCQAVENPPKGNRKFEQVRKKAREILETIHGIPKERVIITYGEQADPPIIKNTGKAFLAAVIQAQLKSRGITTKAAYFPLLNDIFGSNQEVFRELELLTNREAIVLGRQTYLQATVPRDYVERIVSHIETDHPKRKEQLSKIGINQQSLQELAKEKSLGEFNISLKEMLEKCAGYPQPTYSLSPLEDKVIRDDELRTELLRFSDVAGSKAPLYVLWKALDVPEVPQWSKGREVLDSGFRRCRVILEDSNAKVQDPEQGLILAEAPLDELLKDTRAKEFSLNAGSRAALLYVISIPGVFITGGGSTYNESMIRRWQRDSLPLPTLTYIDSEGFLQNRKRLSLDLPSKKDDIMEVLANSGLIRTTQDPIFDYFATWRVP